MSFWKPGIERTSGGEDGNNLLTYNKYKNLSIQQQRNLLPIKKFRDEIIYLLELYSVIVLIGETGSGKSTQIPIYLHHAGWTSGNRCIVCTQPRRIAAVNISQRVAVELDCHLGEEVGYSIRFDSKISNKTVIKYCTDGVLLRETLFDPLLSKYSVVIVDEAHERSLHSDILLGLLKKIKRKRKDLRIIVTSATINAAEIRDFFNDNKSNDPSVDTSRILSIEGRQHPVDIFYSSKPFKDYLKAAVDTVISIHRHEDMGDILVFLPGGEEIDEAVSLLKELCHYYQQSNQLTSVDYSKIIAKPLYSSLPYHAQIAAFERTPNGFRKVVFATNIAETSITLDGIAFVVDSGFSKLNYFDVENSVEYLVTAPISQASAAQRAGRAGRTRSGKCYRLMTEPSFQNLSKTTIPEMQRVDITWAVLQLKALGIHNVLRFDFMSPPSANSLIYALEILFSLGAIDRDGFLTKCGEQMAEMPLEPRLAKCLLSSFEFGCSEEMLIVASMCSVEYPFLSLRHKASQESKKQLLDTIGNFVSLEGDHVTLLKVYRGFVENGEDSSWCDSMMLQSKILKRASEIHGHLRKMLLSYRPEGMVFASCGEDMSYLRKCIVSGYFANVAKLHNDGRYHTVRGNVIVEPHPNCVYARYGTPPEWIVFHDILHASTAQIREVTKINPMWLTELVGHYYVLDTR